MPNILDPEWRASLAPTNYPFADTASLTNSEGDFIPQGMLLDASLYLIGAQSRLYISQITITAPTVTFSFSDTSKQTIATASFPLLDPPAGLQVLDNYGRPGGLLVADPANLAVLQSWSPGSHVFLLGSTEFAARVVIPTPEIGLRGFQLADGSVFTGDVWFVGGDGVVLSHGVALVETGFQAEPTELQFLRIDIVGDALYLRQQCTGPNLFVTTNFLRVLRLQRGCDFIDLVPDANGNIDVTGGSHLASDTVLRVRPTSSGLLVETIGGGS